VDVAERALDLAIQVRNRAAYRRLRTGKLRPMAEAGAIFVHIPKTAGISVATAVYGPDAPAGHLTAAAYRRIFGWRDYERMFTFAFSREPLARLASAYEYIKAGGRAEQDLRPQGVIAACGSLDEFALEWLARPEVQQIPHFRPQLSYLVDRRGRIIVDFVGRFERLADDFAVVAERLGVAQSLPVLNPGPRESVAGLVSSDAVAAATRFYAADFRAFGYPEP
jgi:hypothetical protein